MFLGTFKTPDNPYVWSCVFAALTIFGQAPLTAAFMARCVSYVISLFFVTYYTQRKVQAQQSISQSNSSLRATVMALVHQMYQSGMGAARRPWSRTLLSFVYR
jgi:hypothetical protein